MVLWNAENADHFIYVRYYDKSGNIVFSIQSIIECITFRYSCMGVAEVRLFEQVIHFCTGLRYLYIEQTNVRINRMLK